MRKAVIFAVIFIAAIVFAFGGCSRKEETKEETKKESKVDGVTHHLFEISFGK